MRGGQSELVTAEAVKSFLDLVPEAEFVDVAGTGHMVAGNDNDAFTEAVAEFLTRHHPTDRLNDSERKLSASVD